MIASQSNSSYLGVNSFQISAVNWLSVLVFEVVRVFCFSQGPLYFTLGYSKILHQGWLLGSSYFKTKLVLVAFWQYTFWKLTFLYTVSALYFFLVFPQESNYECLPGSFWALILFKIWWAALLMLFPIGWKEAVYFLICVFLLHLCGINCIYVSPFL